MSRNVYLIREPRAILPDWFPSNCQNLLILDIVLCDDYVVLQDKGHTYGDSWKKRGGVGAFMMLARKWDRIENQAEAAGYDIFSLLDEEWRDGGENLSGSFVKDGLADDIADLRRYLALVESEIRWRHNPNADDKPEPPEYPDV